MVKKRYLAIVSQDFDPESLEFQKSLSNLEMSLDKHFPELSVIKLSTSKRVNKDIKVEDLPFIEYIEIEEEVRLPPGEVDEN